MSQITVSHLTFAYEGSYDNIFEDVSFQMDTDWKLGFTGRNGRGKTTFLNLLLGKYPFEGVISSSTAFEYFPFEIPDRSLLTAEIAGSLYPDFELWRLRREYARLGLAEDILYRPFAALSNGEQTKALLAILFLKETRFLLIDEPTNHLDAEARRLVCEYLNSKKGFILVSHDRAFLDHCIDHILSINKTNIEIQKGTFSSWLENKEMQDHYERAENEKLKREIRQLGSAARQSGEWADRVEAAKIGKKSRVQERCIDTRAYIGEKSRRMQQRRKNLERRRQTAMEEKSGLLHNIEDTEALKLFPAVYHAETLVSLRDLSLFYGDVCALNGFHLEIKRGDRIALQGRNGCGKSSVLKLLAGESLSFQGTVRIGSGLTVSYVPQDASFLNGSFSDYALRYGIDESLFKALLRKLDFSRTQFDKRLEELSEGQQKKILLARSLCEQAHLYIWDEPLNFIDIFSRMQLEALLLSCRPTLLFVEHDQSFTDKIATKIAKLDSILP